MPAGDSIPRCILLVVLILSAGFFTGSETALSYVNHVRMKTLADDGDRRAARVLDILDHFDNALVTLLIGTNVIYVSSSTIATMLAIDWIGGYGSAAASVVMTLLIYLFCETIPKNIAKTNCDTFALIVSLPVKILTILLFPISIIFSGIGAGAKKLLGKYRKNEPSVTEDELSTMVDAIEEEGVIEPEQSQIIRSAIEFGDITAADVMTPREKIVAVRRNAPPEEWKKLLVGEKYSRIPVYTSDIDHIVGIAMSSVCLLRLIRGEELELNGQVMPRPFRISPETKLNDLFGEMSRRRLHMALVCEDGKTLGLVTMDDILEQLVGEMTDDEPADASANATSGTEAMA